MRWKFLLLMAVAVLTAIVPVWAIDINPSKNNQPPSFWESGGGNRFSIFNGDPKRIQRANAVDPKSFDSKIEISPNPAGLQSLKAAATNPQLKITFSIHNHGKKTFTLSFPDAQRWDFRILNPAGAPVYVYSENCEFEKKVGSSIVNFDDKLVYSEIVSSGDLSQPLAPGIYTVECVLANYPEIHGDAKLTVQP